MHRCTGAATSEDMPCRTLANCADAVPYTMLPYSVYSNNMYIHIDLNTCVVVRLCLLHNHFVWYVRRWTRCVKA